MKIKVSGVPYEVDIGTLEQENRQMRARMNRLEEENKLLQERELVRLTEQKPFIVDRGCWERGCMAYDCRDADAVTIEAKLKDKNT